MLTQARITAPTKTTSAVTFRNLIIVRAPSACYRSRILRLRHRSGKMLTSRSMQRLVWYSPAVIIAIPGDETNALTLEQFGEAGLGPPSARGHLPAGCSSRRFGHAAHA